MIRNWRCNSYLHILSICLDLYNYTSTVTKMVYKLGHWNWGEEAKQAEKDVKFSLSEGSDVIFRFSSSESATHVETWTSPEKQ